MTQLQKDLLVARLKEKKEILKYQAVCKNMIIECKESRIIESEKRNWEQADIYNELLSFYFSEIDMLKKALVKCECSIRSTKRLIGIL